MQVLRGKLVGVLACEAFQHRIQILEPPLVVWPLQPGPDGLGQGCLPRRLMCLPGSQDKPEQRGRFVPLKNGVVVADERLAVAPIRADRQEEMVGPVVRAEEFCECLCELGLAGARQAAQDDEPLRLERGEIAGNLVGREAQARSLLQVHCQFVRCW